jgi:hypothetical protein
VVIEGILGESVVVIAAKIGKAIKKNDVVSKHSNKLLSIFLSLTTD